MAYTVLNAIILIAALAGSAAVAERGFCLDSAKEVPMNVTFPWNYTTDVVRIDKLRSDDVALQLAVVGFVYTRQDRKQYFGARKTKNLPEGAFTFLNRFLESVVPSSIPYKTVDPRSNGGILFPVHLDHALLKKFKLHLEPCVEWPSDRPLPDQPGWSGND